MPSRPVVIIGNGERRTIAQTLAWAESCKFPILTTWGAMDLVPSDHPLNFGGFGVVGSRLGNKILFESDLIIPFGASLNQMQSGSAAWFHGKIDRALMQKGQEFYRLVTAEKDWVSRCNSWRFLKNIGTPYDVCPYKLVEELNKYTKEGDIVVADAGANLCQTFQRIKVKKGMRVFTAFNFSPMGYSLPAAIGASLAQPGARVVATIGDGGLLMCSGELATVVRHTLPLKILLFNNQGHSIQKQTMRTWLKDGRLHGADWDSGLGFPDYEKLADSFGIHYARIDSNKGFYVLEQVMADKEPWLVDVRIDPESTIVPFLKAGQKLEDI